MRKLEPVIIDPRRHDAVLFDLDTVVTAERSVFDSSVTLVRQLQEIGVGTAAFSADTFSADKCQDVLTAADIGDLFGVRVDGPFAAATLVEGAEHLATRPGRCVVVAKEPAAVAAARDAGFALVVGVDRTGHRDALRRVGADAVVADLSEVTVRTGDRRMSQLPDALQALGLAEGLRARQPAVFFDFDGTLSDIVDDPESARPAPGAAEAVQKLAAQAPVAILSGRDLADVTERVGLPGIWYAGSHGFELTAPDGTHHQNDAAKIEKLTPNGRRKN